VSVNVSVCGASGKVDRSDNAGLFVLSCEVRMVGTDTAVENGDADALACEAGGAAGTGLRLRRTDGFVGQIELGFDGTVRRNVLNI
jgi:hypothetical protein